MRTRLEGTDFYKGSERPEVLSFVADSIKALKRAQTFKDDAPLTKKAELESKVLVGYQAGILMNLAAILKANKKFRFLSDKEEGELEGYREDLEFDGAKRGEIIAQDKPQEAISQSLRMGGDLRVTHINNFIKRTIEILERHQ